MDNRYCIHVPLGPESPRLETLFSLLEGVMPTKCFSFSEQEQQIHGKILTLTAGDARGIFSRQVPSLSLPDPDRSGSGELIPLEVQFCDDPLVPFPFRGRTLQTNVATQPTILVPGKDEKVLASSQTGPVWTFWSNEGTKHYRSGFPLPELPAAGRLLDVLNGRRFLEILPLIDWLREIEEATEMSPRNAPPLRACFIFDDPNLHWPNYGYADYRQLAASAETHNYHISFAAIPLDTWFTHASTAAIFRAHKNRLSLLIHGNNHTSRELAQPGTHADRVVLLKEALTRIERLERQSGLEVSRVMVPPHGACSEEMLMALPVCSFQAMCLSHAGLSAYNSGKDWTKFVGYLPFELIQGCPVLPRWPLSAIDLENTVLLAAYLKQAIILYGHHQDLKNGPAVLEKAADFINSLGHPVQWLGLSGILESGHLDRALIRNEGVQTHDTSSKPSVARETASKRQSIKDKAAPFIRRILTEGRDRLLR